MHGIKQISPAFPRLLSRSLLVSRNRPTEGAPAGEMSTQETKGAQCKGAARATVRPCPSFSALPDVLLLIVYRFLAESPSSRMRFSTVCRSWRAAVAAEQRVPALPWLLLSPRDAGDRTWRAHCPEDGAAMRFQHCRDIGTSLVGGYDGGWVVFSQQPPLRIVNLFTGAEVALSEKQKRITCLFHGRGDAYGPVVLKIVFSKSPTSDGCIMAAMTRNCGIAVCRVDCPRGGWTIYGCHMSGFMDIAFCNGELYGIRPGYNDLVKFEIRVKKDVAPVVTEKYRLNMLRVDRPSAWSTCDEYTCYIVDLHGKCTIVVINRRCFSPRPFFRMFRLNPTTWSEVTSLGDHALFLGQKFSKVVHMPADRLGDIERNHIYYCNHRHLHLCNTVNGDEVFLTISQSDGDLKYHKEHYNKRIADNFNIRSVGYFMEDHRYDSMWLLPPDI
ncbi:hypothetical protein CFC21_044811 [Triticum aestivum]|uniref:KIB1-4 beta-propeller domain-containing protein n=2 Tax=Triticum aestivum TaxID=4565 RepID=A0A3B6G233_WHEAT|nr:hypothetical protein CFC21_044811 [Triticum aestivum]